MPARRDITAILLLLTLGCAVFLPGIDWGLPSRSADVFLFGDRAPWSGREILERIPARPATPAGADVDANPLAMGNEPLVVNDTDARRAEIVRRYRLFTYQPDEMITLMSLARMKPSRGDLDPRLYQYGGLWIYPVGAILAIGGKIGIVTISSDLAWHMDHPENFGRFYVIARLYSAAWGLAGISVIYAIMRLMKADRVVAFAAAAACALMPAVINAAHEAKPHLAGAALTLLACAVGIRFVQTRRSRWALLAGALCGAAMGMVLSGWTAFVLLVPMAVLTRVPWCRRAMIALASGGVGVLVYAATNPYVVINALWHREILRSNLGNSTAMYQVGPWPEAMGNAIRLIAAGASPIVIAAGVAGAAAIGIIAVRCKDRAQAARFDGLAMLAFPAGLVLAQFIALAAGKPAEYARFALLIDIALAIAAASAISMSRSGRSRVALSIVLPVAVAMWAAPYVLAFVKDAQPRTGRLVLAGQLESLKFPGAALGLTAEPAPYSMPPVDLWTWKLLVVPPAGRASPDVAIYPKGLNVSPSLLAMDPVPLGCAEGWSASPITWAFTGFELRARASGERSAVDRSHPRFSVTSCE